MENQLQSKQTALIHQAVPPLANVLEPQSCTFTVKTSSVWHLEAYFISSTYKKKCHLLNLDKYESKIEFFFVSSSRYTFKGFNLEEELKFNSNLLLFLNYL